LQEPGVKVQNVREFNLMTAVAPVDLGTGEFQAWTYNDQAVGPEIRVTEGEVIRATLTNHLPDPTTIQRDSGSCSTR
jgi:FtsP/CotA-like multicopper oxidase with cupredoxin domain